MLQKDKKHSDSIALTESLLIAVWRLLGDGLALSVCFAATSPIGRGTGVSVRPTRDEQSSLIRKQQCPATEGSSFGTISLVKLL